MLEWKRTEDKGEVIKSAENVLFRRKQIAGNTAAAKKADKHYDTVGGQPQVGDLVRHKTNHQIGTVTEIRDRKATVKIGNYQFQIGIEEWL